MSSQHHIRSQTRGRKIDNIADCALIEVATCCWRQHATLCVTMSPQVLDLQNNHINWPIKPIRDIEDAFPAFEDVRSPVSLAVPLQFV